jgi:hypothetical protein
MALLHSCAAVYVININKQGLIRKCLTFEEFDIANFTIFFSSTENALQSNPI